MQCACTFFHDAQSINSFCFFFILFVLVEKWTDDQFQIGMIKISLRSTSNRNKYKPSQTSGGERGMCVCLVCHHHPDELMFEFDNRGWTFSHHVKFTLIFFFFSFPFFFRWIDRCCCRVLHFFLSLVPIIHKLILTTYKQQTTKHTHALNIPQTRVSVIFARAGERKNAKQKKKIVWMAKEQHADNKMANKNQIWWYMKHKAMPISFMYGKKPFYWALFPAFVHSFVRLSLFIFFFHSDATFLRLIRYAIFKTLHIHNCKHKIGQARTFLYSSHQFCSHCISSFHFCALLPIRWKKMPYSYFQAHHTYTDHIPNESIGTKSINFFSSASDWFRWAIITLYFSVWDKIGKI